MTPDTPNTFDIVRLVLGIARLGGNDLRGWWKGHALDRTGQYVLSSMFRRTWRPAALQLDVTAAARMHDELLGRSTALHMFSDSLPFRRWATAWLGGCCQGRSGAVAKLGAEPTVVGDRLDHRSARLDRRPRRAPDPQGQAR